MNAKTVFSSALVWTVVCLGAVRGQAPSGSPVPPSPTGSYSNSAPNLPSLVPPPSSAPADIAPGSPGAPGMYGPSSWIRGDKYGCCDQPGGSGPIQTELFVRAGPSVPFGHNGQVAESLQTGLDLEAGGRVLFFDPSMEEAWSVELGITNITNHAHSGVPMNLNIFVPQNPNNPATAPNASGGFNPLMVNFGQNGLPGVTLEQLNRTYFDLGGGKDWYIWGSANSAGSKWRVGIDGGGRYGTESAEFNEIPHRTDVIGGLFAAIHSDYECPLCRSFIFQAGVRVEYGYTWSDIMQIQNNSDVQDLNIMISIGVRF
jgi:hypothetical protein